MSNSRFIFVKKIFNVFRGIKLIIPKIKFIFSKITKVFETVFRCIRNLFELFAFFAVSCGIIIFFIEDYQTKEMERVHAAYDLYVLFHSDDYVNLKYSLIEPWVRYDLEKLTSAGMSEDSTYKLVNDIVRKNPDTFKSLYVMDTFVQGLNTCIDSKVCDEETTYLLFGDFVSDVNRFYQPAFMRISQKLQIEDFGKPIKEFSEKADEAKETKISPESNPDTEGSKFSCISNKIYRGLISSVSEVIPCD